MKHEHLDAMIALAAQLNIPIAQEYRAGVTRTLAALLEQAQLVMAFQLPQTPQPPEDFEP